ncbi:MAG TPA: hypothetical protein VFY29_06010 [Terriglobia bacterium]|nr:hypothetical protein [Terriglobia bacterium]
MPDRKPVPSRSGTFETEVERSIDELFQLPLADFTAARNALAGRLKREGRKTEAGQVQSLSKPPVTAWTVNQLYWRKRQSFDHLLTSGQRLREAQLAQLGGKTGDIREPLEARREAIAELARAADALLRQSGHSPAPETMRRIVATLEALSARSDSPPPGRLTSDLDAPGFDFLVTLVSDTPARKPAVIAAVPEKAAPPGAPPPLNPVADKIAQAQARLAEAERALSVARTRAEHAATAAREAESDAQRFEDRKRDAEERLKQAKTQAREATAHAIRMTAESDAAEESLTQARRAVEQATRRLRSLASSQSES